jgi:ribosomal protein L11 methyltransferase
LAGAGDVGCRRTARPILDVGTGSGVLAIAAALALRRPVLACDIDPVSVRVARDNARLNRAGGLVALVRANGVGDRRFRAAAPFAIAFANILLGPLKLMAGPLARLAAPGSRLIVSGLLPGQANAALAAYRAHGLVLERRILIGGWATLVLARPVRSGASCQKAYTASRSAEGRTSGFNWLRLATSTGAGNRSARYWVMPM